MNERSVPGRLFRDLVDNKDRNGPAAHLQLQAQLALNRFWQRDRARRRRRFPAGRLAIAPRAAANAVDATREQVDGTPVEREVPAAFEAGHLRDRCLDVAARGGAQALGEILHRDVLAREEPATRGD